MEQIKTDLQSTDLTIRGQAMQDLSLWVQKDSSIHATALEIFRSCIPTESNSWPAISAARGIQLIADPPEGTKAWLTLLNHRNPDVVRHAASVINDPSYVPILIDLLNRRTEAPIRIAAIYKLSRSKAPAAFPAILKFLNIPELRPHVVEALGNFGDPTAIPHIEPLLADKTNAWPEDNHGPMLRVCDLAQSAISQLRRT
jgi:HEAT repeat protein